MDREKALLIADEFPDLVSDLLRESAEGSVQTFRWFINTLYENGYVIRKEENNGQGILAL